MEIDVFVKAKVLINIKNVLWQTDGTSSGTTLVQDTDTINAVKHAKDPILDGARYFGSGSELWRYGP